MMWIVITEACLLRSRRRETPMLTCMPCLSRIQRYDWSWPRNNSQYAPSGYCYKPAGL